MAGSATCAVFQSCHVGLPHNNCHEAWATGKGRRAPVPSPASPPTIEHGGPRGGISSGCAHVGVYDVLRSAGSWVRHRFPSGEWGRKVAPPPVGRRAERAHLLQNRRRRTSNRSPDTQNSHVFICRRCSRRCSVNDFPSTLFSHPTRLALLYRSRCWGNRPCRRGVISVSAVEGPTPGELSAVEEERDGVDEQKYFHQEEGAGGGVAEGSKSSTTEDRNGAAAAPAAAAASAAEAVLVLDREDILGAVVGTSSVLLLSGLGVRQLSHWGATSGWWSGDLSASLPAFYDQDHAIIAGCVWVSTSLLSFALYKAWDEFATMMDTANKLLLDPLKYQDLIWIALLPGISEELLFRGALMPAISLDEKGALLAGIAFGAVHYGQLGRNWAFVLVASAIGTAYGLAAISTGNLGVPIAVHVANNLFASFYWKLNTRSNAENISHKK